MTERKGAAYRITTTRPGATPQPAPRGRRPMSGKTQDQQLGYAPMDIRAKEYERARSGQMTPEEARRVGINLDRL